MQIFNPDNLKNNQRFPVAIAAGLIASVLGAIICSIFTITFKWQLSIVYLASALLIGNAIKKFGRGVDQKFSILAVACFIFSVFLSDFITRSYFFSSFSFSFILPSIEGTIRTYTSITPQSLLSLAIVGYSGYIAYYTAKIV